MKASFSKFVMVVAAVLLFGSALSAGAAEPARRAARLAESASSLPAAGAKLTFRRIFKSSTPEFIEISVREDSDEATYEIRQLDDDPEKLPFEVSAPLRGKMFELAGQLNRFEAQDLDVHRKIANLGEKTFRWEKGAEVHEAVFNYTLNTAAAQLLQIFEGLARQQELLMLLERRMKYDRFGFQSQIAAGTTACLACIGSDRQRYAFCGHCAAARASRRGTHPAFQQLGSHFYRTSDLSLWRFRRSTAANEGTCQLGTRLRRLACG
jgi:hypothetical protein